MPTEVCSECHRNPVERGHYLCADCEAVVANQEIVDERYTGKRRGAAGPTERAKGSVEAASWHRWRLSPVFIALLVVVAWSCMMAWNTYQHPGAKRVLSMPETLQHMGKTISNTAQTLIQTMK